MVNAKLWWLCLPGTRRALVVEGFNVCYEGENTSILPIDFMQYYLSKIMAYWHFRCSPIFAFQREMFIGT